MAGELKNKLIGALGTILVAVAAFVVFIFNDSGHRWYYRHFTKATLIIKLADGKSKVSPTKIFLDNKDTLATGSDGSVIFPEVAKGTHVYSGSYHGQSFSNTFFIDDTVKVSTQTWAFDSGTNQATPVTRHLRHPVVTHTASVKANGDAGQPVKTDSAPKVQQVAQTPVEHPLVLKRTFDVLMCKAGYYVLFDDIRVWVNSIDQRNATINVKICYTANAADCSDVIQSAVPVQINIPYEFVYQDKSYKLKLNRIGAGGFNRLTPASYVNLEVYGR